MIVGSVACRMCSVGGIGGAASSSSSSIFGCCCGVGSVCSPSRGSEDSKRTRFLVELFVAVVGSVCSCPSSGSSSTVALRFRELLSGLVDVSSTRMSGRGACVCCCCFKSASVVSKGEGPSVSSRLARFSNLSSVDGSRLPNSSCRAASTSSGDMEASLSLFSRSILCRSFASGVSSAE